MPRSPSRAPSRRPFFAAGLWLALVTAALSALIPGGLPRSAATGSAFSPATSIEALRAGSPSVRHGARRRVPDGNRTPAFWRRARAIAGWYLAAVATLRLRAPRIAAPTDATASAAQGSAFPPAHDFFARGPPLG
ncbi:MAG TPA: hypothetical protein VM657_05730 [Sphingomonas sp.]|nr:hypothetical protein [Sphingomonas sp.]